MYPLPRLTPAPLDPQSRDVIQAAGMLEISEYDFMAIAYREWFGSSATRQALEGYFRPYMFGDPPPFWAHRLALEVLDLHERGQLKNSRFAVDPPPRATMRDVSMGITQLIIMLCVLWIIFDAVLSTTGHM
ncbi:hypothetical protein J2T57_003498 [Natronocella acetinitrilica]|uniref:Uncharacterized protein n=1 Tax=Natronocella acetinitrilica TaxID=414046 RepID=A0AAE3G6J3_9GAMM|nr:hypothetical protein [Natronocella acetinitrilica]MCP1676337.1 hypothetical protein [Natronocella acetinitrilica]